ncbi:hypothetical protein BC937DRAFT_94291 [Endogone sp. FLAS-F59071]|nr:hypothetical protein BC937DRAFT_94291 [Endogone sp. FLAS-F59071]|eukprot:RUS20826.1 hypothetical protein BC937DRAFT_94291 [Endogone sp. FLAS-F59071]
MSHEQYNSPSSEALIHTEPQERERVFVETVPADSTIEAQEEREYVEAESSGNAHVSYEEQDYIESVPSEANLGTSAENAYGNAEGEYDELVETREINYEHPLKEGAEYTEQYELWRQEEYAGEQYPEEQYPNEQMDIIEEIVDLPDGDVTQLKGFQNARETENPVDLKLLGALPQWLKGELFTIGPGTYDIKYSRKIEVDGLLETATSTFTFGHWFDNLPLVNRFDLDGPANQITYRSRLTSKRLITKIRDHHGFAPSHPAGLFRTDTNQSILVKLIKLGVNHAKPDYEPCNASISTEIPGVEGRLFSLNNASQVQELDPFDLKPTRLFSWDQHNPAFKGYTACPHPQYDSATGEWINFTQELGYQTTAYNFFSLSEANPAGSLIASVTAKTSFVHSFALTRRYIVLVVFPLVANYAGIKFAWNESVLDSFTFTPSEPTLFYVISRESKKHIVTYRADAAFAFHHINAFEDESDSLILDIACYDDATIAYQLSLPSLRNPAEMHPARLSPSQIRRYTLAQLASESERFAANNSYIPTNSILSLVGMGGSSTPVSDDVAGKEKKQSVSIAAGWYGWMPETVYEIVAEGGLELPQVNPRFRLHRYRYLYGVGLSERAISEPGRIWDSIVKADLTLKSTAAMWQQAHCFPSEPLFIPTPSMADRLPTASPPNSEDEDDGVLVSIVLDSERNRSFLLILDARTLQEVTKADLPAVVPLSFSHGTFRKRM